MVVQAKTPLQDAFSTVRPALGCALWLSVFINLALFAAPLYSLQVYDRVLSSRSLGTLAMLTLIVGVFLALYGILEYARSGTLVRGGVRFNNALAAPLFDLAMRAQLSGRPAAGAQALKDAETLRDALSGTTVTALFDVPWTPVFVGICFLFHPMMGVVALTGALLIFACALLTELATKQGVAQSSAHAVEVGRLASGTLRNAETVCALGMSTAIMTRWRALQNAMLTAHTGFSERAALLLAVTKVVRMCVQIALIGVGAWLAIDRLISPGVMMAATIIMARALSPVEQAVSNWKRIIAARAAAERLEELFKAFPAPAVATELPRPAGQLDVESLVLKPARGGHAVIKDVSFAIPSGSALAIIGPSGGGKSSLVKALVGVWQPALGAIRLDRASLVQWQPQQLGQAIGYLPQEVEFFAGTVAENIARLGEFDDAAVVKAATSAGVHTAILKLPNGYATSLADGDVVLSGGMRQRLALARAIYGDPCLIVMDEPNSNLDSEGEVALAKAMTEMKAAGRTVVVVTHRPQLLAHVDHVLVLAEGRVQAFGSRDEILTKLNGPKIAALRRTHATSDPASRDERHHPVASATVSA